jgi:hypothetical protein
VKILILPGKGSFTLFISFSLSCCASGQALIHLGVQGRLTKKKRSKEKSSQQKTPAWPVAASFSGRPPRFLR